MQNAFTDVPTTRREFLRQSASGLGLLAFGSVAPAFLAQSAWAGVPVPESDRSILVLIQLAGGNDGLNTLVPFEDDNYRRLRPKLAIPRNEVIRISDQLGFHPSCRELAELHKSGQLAVIQNVGYPNPNRSHFRSMEIWETASRNDEYLTSGWIGRYFDNCCSGAAKDEPPGLALGNEMPDVFLADKAHNTFSLAASTPGRRSLAEDLLNSMPPQQAGSTAGNAGFLNHVHMNALVTERTVLRRLRDYKPMVVYPDSQLAQGLLKIAALIAAGQETRVYFLSLGGFDTHASQLNRHQALLRELSSAMSAFQADLAAHKLDDQVLTMTFSEFGRRPSENATGGTDHGTAAPLFVMGNQLTASLLGSPPDLSLQHNRDIAFTTDFRSVYATILERWFEADALPVLGQRFETLPFLA